MRRRKDRQGTAWSVLVLCVAMMLLALVGGISAGTPTESFRLEKPDDGDRNWGSSYRSTMSTIDHFLPGFRFPQTVDSTISVGDTVFITATPGFDIGTVSLASSATTSTAAVLGVAVDVTTTDALIQFVGVTPPLTFSGLTTGVQYFLDDVTPGAVTATPPLTPSVIVEVGVAVSDTRMAVNAAPGMGFTTFTPQSLAGNLVPDLDITYNLGAAPKRWLEGHIQALFVSEITFDGNLTITDTDGNLYITMQDTGGGGKTLTLPTLADNQGRLIAVKRDDAADSITIDGEGAETIDSSATFVLANDDDFVWLIGDTAEWKILSKSVTALDLSAVAQDIIPSIDDTFDLGTAALSWQDVFLYRLDNPTGQAWIDIASELRPSATATFDLGDLTRQFLTVHSLIFQGSSGLFATGINAANITGFSGSSPVTLEFGYTLGGTTGKENLGTGHNVTLGVAATTFVPTATRVNLTGDAGGNTVATISSTNFATGGVLRIMAVALGGGITLTDDAAPIFNELSLSGNWVPAAADDTLTLIWNGTYWIEFSRTPGLTVDFGSFAESLIPSIDNTFNLGSSAFAWNNVWSDKLEAGFISSSLTLRSSEDTPVIIHATDANNSSALDVISFRMDNNLQRWILRGSSFDPSSDNTHDLGITNFAFRRVYSNLLVSGTDTNLVVQAYGDGGGDIADIEFWAGNSQRWKLNQSGTLHPNGDGFRNLGDGANAMLNVYTFNVLGSVAADLTLRSEGDQDVILRADGDGAGDSADILFSTGNSVTRWTIDEIGHLFGGADETYDIGTATVAVRDLFVVQVRQESDEDTTTPIALTATSHVKQHADTTSNDVEYDLPTCSAANDGLEFVFKKLVAANNMVIDPNGAETIDGSATSVSISAQWNGLTIYCKGTGATTGWMGR